MKVRCSNCNCHLFDTDSERLSKVAVEAGDKGFVVKHAGLFSDKYGWLFFCSASCKKDFYDREIPKTERNKIIQEALEETRKDIPRMAKECCEGLNKLMVEINRRRNGNTNKKV